MEQQPNYIGFPPLPDADTITHRILTDPPQVRWRVARQLFQIRQAADRQTLIEQLHPYLHITACRRVRERIALALQVLQHPVSSAQYALVRGEGVQRVCEKNPHNVIQNHIGGYAGFDPVVDFHVHPQTSDISLLTDMHEAGVTHAVLLATDTDPEDTEHSSTEWMLRRVYQGSACSNQMTYNSFKNLIISALSSSRQVSGQDVADWVADYPKQFRGLGSVNLSREPSRVEKDLQCVANMGLKGINLLPQQQFFNPAQHPNMKRVLDFCRAQQMLILTHSGCGEGPFEMPELCQNAHPSHWSDWLQKYPEVPLVLAHLGAYTARLPAAWLHEALQLGQKYRQVYADISRVGWMLNNAGVVREIRKTMGFDRILLGSGYPRPVADGLSMASIVGSIKANLYLTDKEKRKILGLNAARLLGL